jgi:hypothetical protein
VAAGMLRALPLRGAEAGRTYAYARRAGRELSAAARDLVGLLEGENGDQGSGIGGAGGPPPPPRTPQPGSPTPDP